jgi:hypothetical protein
MRQVLSSLLALAGAACALIAPFPHWYDGRPGVRMRVRDLVHGLTGMDADVGASLFLPLAFAAFVALVSAARRSRALMTLGGLLVLATVSLSLTRQADSADGLEAGLAGPGLAVAVASGAALLAAAATCRSDAHRPPYTPDGGGRRTLHRPASRQHRRRDAAAHE